MRMTAWQFKLAVLAAGLALYHLAQSGSDTRQTQFTNRDGIVNTRHNLTQSTMLNGGGAAMNGYRNNYRQVCVYCHTPHGANTAAAAPLWNRILPSGSSFKKYSDLGTSTLNSALDAPGANSLTCLSCHDGTTAIDAIFNMPGSGRYGTDPTNLVFLNTWQGPPGNEIDHSRLGNETLHTASNTSTPKMCMSCHQPNSLGGDTAAADFSIFVIGTNLTNDHPIGVQFPGGTPNSTGFNDNYTSKTQPNGKVVTYYNKDGIAGLGKGDPRFYDNKVECGSCHDPHGVPDASGDFYPTFLRVTASGSTICLTCHAK